MNHVFISYVRENEADVQRLCDELASRGIEVWLARNDIDPGKRWKQAIRRAIQDGAFFIACFSKEYNKREKTYMNEELTLAIEELRERPRERAWFIPVKLSKCEIPDWDIGGGETLTDIQWVDLYEDWNDGIRRILRSMGISQAIPNQNNASNIQFLPQMIETSQRQAEIALSDAAECVNSISPRMSLVKPERILQRHLGDYDFRFNGQFTVINSDRLIIFHKEKRAMGHYYSEFLPEYDIIYENHVVGKPSGILRVIDFLLTDPRWKNVKIPASGNLSEGLDWILSTSIDWIRFNVCPFAYFEYRDWYIIVEAHTEIHELETETILDLARNFQQKGWLIVGTPYYLRKRVGH